MRDVDLCFFLAALDWWGLTLAKSLWWKNHCSCCNFLSCEVNVALTTGWMGLNQGRCSWKGHPNKEEKLRSLLLEKLKQKFKEPNAASWSLSLTVGMV